MKGTPETKQKEVSMELKKVTDLIATASLEDLGVIASAVQDAP